MFSFTLLSSYFCAPPGNLLGMDTTKTAEEAKRASTTKKVVGAIVALAVTAGVASAIFIDRSSDNIKTPMETEHPRIETEVNESGEVPIPKVPQEFESQKPQRVEVNEIEDQAVGHGVQAASDRDAIVSILDSYSNYQLDVGENDPDVLAFTNYAIKTNPETGAMSSSPEFTKQLVAGKINLNDDQKRGVEKILAGSPAVSPVLVSEDAAIFDKAIIASSMMIAARGGRSPLFVPMDTSSITDSMISIQGDTAQVKNPIEDGGEWGDTIGPVLKFVKKDGAWYRDVLGDIARLKESTRQHMG